jgi:nucleoside-diphosphate-sugar epimerase
MRVILTGANGFVGGHLKRHLICSGYEVSSVVRATSRSAEESSTPRIVVDSLQDYMFGKQAGETVVIHAAARAHILNDSAEDPLAAYRADNTDTTLSFAHNAGKAGVKRFVFISTVKVNGEQTSKGVPFTASDVPMPEDPYAISKSEAEMGLKAIAQETGMEVVIIRPPLVYGQGVKGNFATLMAAVSKGVPLPLGSIHNKRSMVGIHNLVDLIECAVRHPNAAGNTFMVSDGQDLSTTELLRAMIKSYGSKSILLPIPPIAIHVVASLFGKRDMSTRLLESLQVDITATKNILNWNPPFTIEQELDHCFTSTSHD